MSISLCERYKDYFKIGAAVNNKTLHSARELIVSHFNSITCENQMKPEPIHPGEEVWNFDGADEIADFARANRLKMRGHTLLWHQQFGRWMLAGEDGGYASKEIITERLRGHMETLIDRYKDVIWCWDVVNEAVSDKDIEGDGLGSILREGIWRDAFGLDYVDTAFRLAGELVGKYAPTTRLVYNDYNACVPAKRERICRLVGGMKAGGLQVDDVGIQGHWSLNFPNADEIRRSIEAYASLGCGVQITELDVSVYENDKSPELTGDLAAVFERQAERYDELFRIFREYRDVISCVTFWGVADDATWLDHFPVREGRKNYPLLFDTSHEPKPAFERVISF